MERNRSVVGVPSLAALIVHTVEVHHRASMLDFNNSSLILVNALALSHPPLLH